MFNNSYVYIIQDKKTKFYKIGKTNNLFRRFLQIVGFFTFFKIDYNNSYYIKCKNETEALELENYLHILFKNKHINPKYIKYKSGYTEWFMLDKDDLNKIHLLSTKINRKFKKIGLFKYFIHFFIKNRLTFNIIY